MHGVSIALTLSMAAHGWGPGHQVIRERAIASLPAWQQELLGDAGGALCGEYLALQDKHAGGSRPALDAYCKPEGASVSLHDINPVGATTVALQWYLRQIRHAVQAGEMDEAARYLGVLCHWFEDPGSPSMHATEGFINEPFLRELVPPPDELRKWHYLYGHSGIADNGQYALPAQKEYTPVLLGRTIPEAALHMQRRQKLQARGARRAIIPLALAHSEGDAEEAARIRGELLCEAAKTTADLLHTALSLAANRVEGDTAHLDETLLTEFVSDYRGGKTSMPWAWVPFLIDACFDEQRNVVALQVAGGEQFEHGIGMGAPFALSWTVGPGGVYSRFSATVGLHPASAENTSAIFALLADGEEIACTQPIAAGAPAQELEAALSAEGDAIELTLQMRVPEGSSGEGCLAIWGAPRLVR